MALIRVEIFYSGNVQGVGFRYTVRRIADQFNVVGLVKNIRDGRVQLVAEGEKDEVDAFLTAIDGSMGGYIYSRKMQQSVASGQSVSFDIQF